MRAKKKGIKLSKEHKENISKAVIDWQSTPEARIQMSKRTSGHGNPNHGKLGENSPNFGRKNTTETKEKMSQAAKGRIPSLATREKLRNTYKIEDSNGLIIIVNFLEEFCEKVDIKKISTFRYTIISKKFMNGYRVLENLGRLKT